MATEQTWLEVAPDGSHERVLALLAPGARVLAFGSAVSGSAMALAQRLGCRVTCVHPAADVRDEAHARGARTVAGDPEELDLSAALGDERFDVVLLGDTLARARDGTALLARVQRVLADRAMLIGVPPDDTSALVLDLRRRLIDAERRAEEAAAELASQGRELAAHVAHLDALRSEIAVVTARQVELRQLLLDAHDQLLERDEALRDAQARVKAAEDEVEFMKSTKAWRIATWYWRLRSARAEEG